MATATTEAGRATEAAATAQASAAETAAPGGGQAAALEAATGEQGTADAPHEGTGSAPDEGDAYAAWLKGFEDAPKDFLKRARKESKVISDAVSGEVNRALDRMRKAREAEQEQQAHRDLRERARQGDLEARDQIAERVLRAEELAALRQGHRDELGREVTASLRDSYADLDEATWEAAEAAPTAAGYVKAVADALVAKALRGHVPQAEVKKEVETALKRQQDEWQARLPNPDVARTNGSAGGGASKQAELLKELAAINEAAQKRGHRTAEERARADSIRTALL